MALIRLRSVIAQTFKRLNARLFTRSFVRLFVCSTIFLSACAPVKWAAVLDKNADLAWPPPPSAARVKYVGELQAFTPTGESLFTKLFGRDKSGDIKKPVAVAVGGDGRLAIADSALSGVHLFIPNENKYVLLRGTGKEMFVSPVSVVFNEEMQLFISDSTRKAIYLFDKQGIWLKTIESGGNIEFQRPTGLIIQPKDNLLYMVDTLANKIFIFDDHGVYKNSFGDRGVDDGEFNFPTHIAADYYGRVYVNDTMNFRLQIFDPEGVFISMFGSHGNGSGDFAMSKGVVVDKGSTIYVVDTLFDRVQMFDMKGDYLMAFGGKGTGPGEFWLPSGLFFDYHTNRLYVCDTYNKRVQIFQVIHEEELPLKGG